MEDEKAWSKDYNAGTIEALNEPSENPIWVVLADGDDTSEEWKSRYKREKTPNSKVSCYAKRLIGRIPQYIKNETGNENLTWG